MLRTNLLSSWHLAVTAVRSKVKLLTRQELAFAVVGGIALAGISQLLGRTFHLLWPVPMSGSIVVALPRAIVLLIILLRTDRFGALTIAGIAEVSTKLSVGFIGSWPMSLMVPLLAGVAGDFIWWNLRRLPSRRLSLILTGGSLCGARMLIALSFWTFLPRPITTTLEYLIPVLGGIVVINIVLGMVAGLLVSRTITMVKNNK
jgi:hypothetical protein